MSTPRPVIVAAARTPIGTAGRSLAGVGAADLAVPVLGRLKELTSALGTPDEVLLGNCMGPGGNVARVAALAAGLPDTVPASTVDRQCASGLSALSTAAALLAQGARLVLAGGTESASTAPWRSWPPTAETPEPVRYTRAPFAPEGRDVDMAVANDAFAAAHGITRAAQEEYAARSHARAVAARDSGRFAAEIVPVSTAGGLVDTDDRPRATLTTDRLARFPLLHPDDPRVAAPSMTVGTSCGVNDGAAALAVLDGRLAREHALPGLEVLATATTGHDPREPGAGLVAPARAVLARAGLTWHDVDVIEFNEAFAGQVLACCSQLGLDPARVCPQGGALALGHPWGASGAVLAVRLFHQLVPTPGRIGLACVSAGGGQGVAVLVRAVA